MLGRTQVGYVRVGNQNFPSLAAVAEAFGLPYNTLYQRIRRGLKPSEAVKVPVRPYVKAA